MDLVQLAEVLDYFVEAGGHARELVDLGTHHPVVAVGGVELSENRVFGPAGEVLGDVLLVAFVGREDSVEMFGDVSEVEGSGRGKGIGGRRSGGITSGEVFVQEGGGALCRSGVSFGHLRDFVRVPRCFLR